MNDLHLVKIDERFIVDTELYYLVIISRIETGIENVKRIIL